MHANNLHANPVTVYVALGANLGKAVQTVQQAIKDLAGLPHTLLAKQSSLYQTAPIDSSGPDYINAVVELATCLPAPLLLQMLQQLEVGAGRQRPHANAPRTLDLDLLLYGSAHIDSPLLTVPHPRMVQRAFVLLPLAEIAPHLVCAADVQAVRLQAVKKLVF